MSEETPKSENAIVDASKKSGGQWSLGTFLNNGRDQLTSFGNGLVENIGKATGLASSISRLAGDLGFGGNNPSGRSGPVVAYQQFNNGLYANDRRIKIKIPTPYLGGPAQYLADVGDNAVVFPYTPQIVVQTRANYNGLNPTHSNYTYYAYQYSALDSISIVGTFSAQNQNDAKYMLGAIHALRAITKMNFGISANSGAPPPVCRLDGYGSYQFSNMPVVISSFFYTLNEDVDYITVLDDTFGATSIPTRAEFTIECLPAFSRKDQAQFSIDDFVSGDLTNSDYGGKGMI